MIKVALFGQKTSTSLTDIIPPFINYLVQNEIAFCVEQNFLQILKETTDFDTDNVETYTSHDDLDKSVKFLFSFAIVNPPLNRCQCFSVCVNGKALTPAAPQLQTMNFTPTARFMVALPASRQISVHRGGEMLSYCEAPQVSDLFAVFTGLK